MASTSATDYRDYLGRFSPKRMDGDDNLYSVIVTQMPDEMYSIHLAERTLYHRVPDIPEDIRTNLLLIKGRHGPEMTQVEHKNICYDLYKELLAIVLVSPRNENFRDIGYMAAPGIYCVTLTEGAARVLLQNAMTEADKKITKSHATMLQMEAVLNASFRESYADSTKPFIFVDRVHE